jgi:hypothetical protein
MHTLQGSRATKQGAGGASKLQSAYGVSSHTPHGKSAQLVDKSSILWKDFIGGIKRRKGLVRRLHDAALESTISLNMLRRQLLEVRNLTLSLIEDALEIEYRFQMFPDGKHGTHGTYGTHGTQFHTHTGHTGGLKSIMNMKLPISSFRAMEDKEDVLALCEIITDVDDLLHIPNIRIMLPRDFPSERNPFLLGKSIDELADLTPPHPQAGNTDEELKVLELLRYKRAAKALLRAECQVQNNLPISLYDMERLVGVGMGATGDENVERLLRATAVLLDNDRTHTDHTQTDHTHTQKEADIRCLIQNPFIIEGFDLLNRLNRYKGLVPMRADVQVHTHI